MGLMGCKWSSLNAPGTENHLSHPLSMLGVQRLFPIAPRKNSNGEWRRGSPITKLRFCFISFMCWIRGCEFWVILLRYSSEAKRRRKAESFLASRKTNRKFEFKWRFIRKFWKWATFPCLRMTYANKMRGISRKRGGRAGWHLRPRPPMAGALSGKVILQIKCLCTVKVWTNSWILPPYGLLYVQGYSSQVSIVLAYLSSLYMEQS